MDFRALDLNLLLVFDALYTERSTVATARKLSISQPTVSNSLKKLREFFSDDLFVRTVHGMVPTPKAKELRKAVVDLVRILDTQITNFPDFDPANTTQTFIINTTDIGEMVFIPPLLKKLREFAPRASLECVCLEPTELARAMQEGTVDLAIGYIPELVGSGIFVQSLFEHPFVCLMSEENALSFAGLSLEQYASAMHITLVGEGHSQKKFELAIEKAVPERRSAFRSQHFMNIPFIVRDTDLIATVPKVIAVAFLETAGLRAVKPPMDIPPIPIKQYWHQNVAGDAGQIWLRKTVSALFLNNDPTAVVQFWSET